MTVILLFTSLFPSRMLNSAISHSLQQSLHILNLFFLVRKHEVQQSFSPLCFPDQETKEMPISALQKPPKLSVLCCALPPVDIRVIYCPIRMRAYKFKAFSIYVTKWSVLL